MITPELMELKNKIKDAQDPDNKIWSTPYDGQFWDELFDNCIPTKEEFAWAHSLSISTSILWDLTLAIPCWNRGKKYKRG